MRRILFRLLDPMVAGRSIRSALDAGVGGGDLARALQSRYEWYACPYSLDQPGEFSIPDPRLPFDDASFDAVLSLDVLSHFERGEEHNFLRELIRVLAPEGLLVLRAPALEVLRNRHSQYYGDRQRFTRARLVNLVEEHGVRVLRSTYVNALLAPFAMLKFRIWEPLLRKKPANAIVPQPAWMDQALQLPLKFEAGWLGAGLNFPIGQTLIVIGEKER